MDRKARALAKAGRAADKASRGAELGRVSIDQKWLVEIAAPAGSRFKGDADYLIQDLIRLPPASHAPSRDTLLESPKIL